MNEINKYQYFRIAGIVGVVVSSISAMVTLFMFIPLVIFNAFCTALSNNCSDLSGVTAGLVFSFFVLIVSIVTIVQSTSKINELKYAKRTAEKTN